MQLIGKNNLKNIDNQNTHSIRITVGQSKDENQNRKYKFLKPTICIALSILLFLITLYFTFNIYDLDTEIDKYIMRSHKISSNRLKRELNDCPECENDVDKNEYKTLQSAVLRCKKNIEKSKDCCELWQKVKELNKVMDDIKKEFNLMDVPCKHKIKSNETEKTGDNKNESSDSSSSESKENEKKNRKHNDKISTIKTTTFDAIYYDDVNEENENKAYENKFSNEDYENAKINKPILQPQYTQNKLYDIYDENFDTKVLDSSEFQNKNPETNIKTDDTNYKPNYNNISEESTIQKEEKKDNTYISNNKNKPEYSTNHNDTNQDTKYSLGNSNSTRNYDYNFNEPNEDKNKIYEPQYSYEYNENDKPHYENTYQDINKVNKPNAEEVNDNKYGAHKNLNLISTTTKYPEYKQENSEENYNINIYIQKNLNLKDNNENSKYKSSSEENNKYHASKNKHLNSTENYNVVTNINNEEEKAETYDINNSKYQENEEINQKLYPYVYTKNKENIPTTTDNQNYDINTSNMDKNYGDNPNLNKDTEEYTEYKSYEQEYQKNKEQDSKTNVYSEENIKDSTENKNINNNDEFNYEKPKSFTSSSPKPSSNIDQNKYNDILDYNDHSNRFFGGKINKINSLTTEKSKITTETQSYYQKNIENSEEIKIKEQIVTTTGNYDIYQETTEKQYKSEFTNFKDDIQVNKDINEDTAINYDQKPNIDNRIYNENNENTHDTITSTNNYGDTFYEPQKDINEKIYSPEYDDINSELNNNQQQNHESNEKTSEEDNDYNIDIKVNINKNEVLPSLSSTTEKVYDIYEDNEESNIDENYDPDIIKEIINDYGDNLDPETNNAQNIDNINESQSKSNEFHKSKEIIKKYPYQEVNDKNLYETTKADFIINYDDNSPTKETENKIYLEEIQNINTEINSNFNNYYTTQNIETIEDQTTIYLDKQLNNEKSDNYDVRIKIIDNNSDFLNDITTSTVRYQQKKEENDDLNRKTNSYEETEVHSAQVYDSYYNSIEDKSKNLDDFKIYKEDKEEIKANNNIYAENEQSNVEISSKVKDYNINYKPKLQKTSTISYIKSKEENEAFDNDNIYETNEEHPKEIYYTNYNSEKEISVESETYKPVKEEIKTTTQNTKLQTSREKIYYDYDQSNKEKSNEEENYGINFNVKIENNNDGILYITSTSPSNENQNQNVNSYEFHDKNIKNNYETKEDYKKENVDIINSDESKIYEDEKQIIESNFDPSAEKIVYDKNLKFSDEKLIEHENYDITSKARIENIQYISTISYDNIKEDINDDINNKNIISSENVNSDKIKQTIEARIYSDKSKESLEIYDKNLNFSTQKSKLPAYQEEIIHYQDKQLSADKPIENGKYDTASKTKIENNNNYIQHISTTSSYNEKHKDDDMDYNYKYGESIYSDENQKVYKDESNTPMKENDKSFIYTTQKSNLPASQEEIIHHQDGKSIENKNYDSTFKTKIENNNNVEYISTTSYYNEQNKDYDTDYKYGESIYSDENQKVYKDKSNTPMKENNKISIYTTQKSNLPASQEEIIHYQDKELSGEKSIENKIYDSTFRSKIENNNNYVEHISTTSYYNEQNKDYDTDYKYGESIYSDENLKVYKYDSKKPIKENDKNFVYTTQKTNLPASQEEIIHYQDKQLNAEKSIENQKYDSTYKTKIENNNNYDQIISTSSSYNEENKNYNGDYNYQYGESIYSDENQKIYKDDSNNQPIKENDENSIYTTQNSNLPVTQEEIIHSQDKQLSKEMLIENRKYDTASKTKIENNNNYVQLITTTSSSYSGQNKDYDTGYNNKYDEIIYSNENPNSYNKLINNNDESFFYTTQRINSPTSQEEIIYEQDKQLNEEKSIENENYVINFKAKIENNDDFPLYSTSTVPPRENINNFNRPIYNDNIEDNENFVFSTLKSNSANNEENIYKSNEEKNYELSTHVPNINGNIEDYSSKININSYIPAEGENSYKPISENANNNNQEKNYKLTSTKPEYYINDSEEDKRDDYYKEINNIMENYDMSYIDEIENLNNTSKTSYSEEDKFDINKSNSHENYKINFKYKIDESGENMNKYSTTEETTSPKIEYTSKINMQTIKYGQEQSFENFDNNNEDTKNNYYEEAKNIMENYDMSYIDETGNDNNTLAPYNSEEKHISIHVNVKENSDENVHPVVSPYTVSAEEESNHKPSFTHSLNDTTDQYKDKYDQAESKIIYNDYDHNYHDSFNKPHFDKDEPKIEQFRKKFREHNFGNPSHLNIMIPETDQNEAMTSTTTKPTEYSYDGIDDIAQNSDELHGNYGEYTITSKEDLIQPSVKLNNSESNKYEITTEARKSIENFDKIMPSNKFDDNNNNEENNSNNEKIYSNEKETKYVDNYKYNAYDSILQTAENIAQSKEETTKAYYDDSEYTDSFYSNNEPNYNKIDSNSLILSEIDTNNTKTHETNLKETSTQQSITTEHYNKYIDTNISTADKIITPNLNLTQNNTETKYYPSKTKIDVKHDTTYTKKDSEHRAIKANTKLIFKEQNKNLSENLKLSNIFLSNETSTQANKIIDNLQQETEEPILRIDSNYKQNISNESDIISNLTDSKNFQTKVLTTSSDNLESSNDFLLNNKGQESSTLSDYIKQTTPHIVDGKNKNNDNYSQETQDSVLKMVQQFQQEVKSTNNPQLNGQNELFTPSSENLNQEKQEQVLQMNSQFRQDVNDIRIVNQNPIAQRFQNTGSGNMGKGQFDNLFQLPPIESSKASQQLTVNTNMMPLCFYGMPNQNAPAFRQPGYESQISPFSPAHTAYSAFGFPQIYPNNLGNQGMFNTYNNIMGQQRFQSPNFMNHQQNPYFCTYVPSSSLQFPPVTGLSEFRNIEETKSVLPNDPDDKTLLKELLTPFQSNKSRSSLPCLPGQRSCFDDSKCIKEIQWCDGVIQCNDQSDELGCSCKTRVDKNRLCDGYFDCPNGEDELGCFGCNDNEFSCDDWTERQKKATCVPLDDRCDGRTQCRTGKDEMDCSLLTNAINVYQTYAVSKGSGFLHRNYKGKWYPVCSNTDTWVIEACVAEVGPHATFPIVRMLNVPSGYHGKFLTAIPNKKVEFLNSCMGDVAVYVICPPIPCGTRLLPPPNLFRKHEVDVSAEEDFLPLVSRLRRFTDEIKNTFPYSNLLRSNDLDEKIYEEFYKTNNFNSYINDDEKKKYISKGPLQGRDKRGETRVVGGKPSQPTSWPWVVAIYRDGIFHCGGVLMSELWIITAAHCVDTYWQHYYEVQAGMLRRFSFSPMEQNRVASKIIGHQLYDRMDMKNDLALLKMSQPFQFNRWVRPICLPSESSAGPNWMWGPTPGTVCTAVGWGATIEHGPDPDHMREVEVPILPRCKHREDQEGQEICAGYLEGGRDACQGDSGGPLLCRNPLAPSQWYVAGIVSHGEGCARPNEPGAYTRVSLYINWIATSILDENLPSKEPLQKCPGTLCLGTHRCIPKKRRCDKTIDCLVGDDEIDCPKSSFPSLIKYAMDNMLLFSTNNITTVEPDDFQSTLQDEEKQQNTTESSENNNESQMETIENDATKIKEENTRKSSDTSNSIITIAKEHTTENDSITSSAFTVDGGQATTMNRNGDISSTFMTPSGEISDVTRTITNIEIAETSKPNQTQSTSIKPSTFITTNDTISESTTSMMSTHATTPVNDVTVITASRSTTEPTSTVINDSRGALNNNDKNMVDARHKNETSFSEDITTETEKSITEKPNNEKKDSNKVAPDKFLCKKLLQVLPISRRCNRVIDCEDGTDEQHCSCKEYLAASYPKAICDGTIDCVDGSDEKNCVDCPDTNFYCHLSGQCIPNFFQCDHKSDCLFGEDEWDCFALTNGSYIRYDKDLRPELRRKGIISVSHAGIWHPLCKSDWFDIAPDVAGDMCIYLGFSGYQKFYETLTIQDSIQTITMDTKSISIRPKTNDTCRALYVKCTNSLSDIMDMKKIHTAHQTGANTFKEVFMSPWNAAIFVNGRYTCTGTLVDKEWVVTSRKCLDDVFLDISYTTVMLGSGRAHQNVVGPHEQIRRISELKPVTNTDVILLRLYKPVTFTRYVRPLFLKNTKTVVTEKETCIAMGRNTNETMETIFLKPVLTDCILGERCFKQIPPTYDCNDLTEILPWGGNIVCLSAMGWYVAATFYERKGHCGFKNKSSYTSIRYLTANILAEMNSVEFTVNPPICNGFRCPLGLCLETKQICDGNSNCRDGSDESQDNCQNKVKECEATNTCECDVSEMRCKNGKCVAKSAFCDRNNDCGDLSDEPPVCNCSSYLQLVAPHRICDGVINCYDKSDENPKICSCHENSFKCGKSDVCIANEAVCDDENDCPNGEDEALCIALKASKHERDGVGEVMLRTYGLWHSYCMPNTPLTSEQLEDICKELNFDTGHAVVLNKTLDSNLAPVIKTNDFPFVKLNHYITQYFRGDYPIAVLNYNTNCKRMYLECT